ncbi:MAG: ABC transporter permease [Hyphomicrobiaceae bacterium]
MVDSISAVAVRSQRSKLPSVWTIATAILIGLLLTPVLAVFVAAAGDSGELWQHLLETVLPRYVANTLTLMAGVGAVSLLFGVPTAWIVTHFRFPGCRIIDWMLLLPAAVPAYLVAYTYTDFLEYAGPIQGMIRDYFGWRSARDYWFPEIRSTEGAILIMGSVLYPYVYLMARTAFLLTPASLYEIGMVSGRNLFWSVGLPLARPAIVAGLALVLMEVVSDFGTVEYFAIETLTLGIFNVWLGMNSLPAAAQIASLSFLFIIILLSIELIARSRRRYMDTTRRSNVLVARSTRGWASACCVIICIVPVLIGFVIPVGVLISFVLRGYSLDLNEAVVAAAFNAFVLAATVALFVMAVASFLAVVSTYKGGPAVRRAAALASIGYAFPGTILAIGVVTASGYIDAGISQLVAFLSGTANQGWLSGSLALVILACVVRFQAIGYGAMTSGIARISPSIMQASRTLGRSFGSSLKEVILPLLTKSLIAGGLLVFVDVLKELPMTLLLRPFNYETLATYVYQFAKDELLEEAALPALMIVATGILPVIIMNAALRMLTR